MTDRELMQQSLDALEGNDLGLHYRTIDALRAALAQPAPAVPGDVSANLPGDMAIAEGAHQFMSRRYYNDETGRGWTEWAPYIPPKGLAKTLSAAPAVREPSPECNPSDICAGCRCAYRYTGDSNG